MILLSIKQYKNKILSFVLLAVIILSANILGGCNEFLSALQSSSSAEETQPKPTVPVRTDGRKLYGYDSISDTGSKALYEKLVEYADKKLALPMEVNEVLSERQIMQAMNAYKNDHPEVFWIKTNCTFITDNNSTIVYPFFTMNNDERNFAKAQLENKLKLFESNAPSGASALELEKYAHDYLIDNCNYSKEAAKSTEVVGNSSDAYGALIEGSAVCEGYARAFSLLCNWLGLDCVCVLGVGDNEYHMWNCVLLDNKWYQVDPTWNDNNDKNNNEPFASSLYFNLDDKDMYNDHTPSKLFSELSDDEYVANNYDANVFLPECSSTAYRYYPYKCAELSNLDNADNIVTAIAESASNKDDYLFIKVSSELDFSSTSDKIINGGLLSTWIDSANWKNMYNNSIETSTMVFSLSKYNLLVIELQYN